MKRVIYHCDYATPNYHSSKLLSDKILHEFV